MILSMRIITELKEILYAKGLTLKFVAQELEKKVKQTIHPCKFVKQIAK